MKISLYIARRFLGHFILGVLIISVLMISLDFIEQARIVNKVKGSMWFAFELVLLHLPILLQQVLPFIVLIAGISTFYTLTKSSELIVVRVVGISIWQILRPLLVIAVLIGLFKIMVLSVLISSANNYSNFLRTKYIEKTNNTLNVDSSGLWLRQQDEQIGLVVLHADHYSQHDDILTLESPEIMFIKDNKITRWISSNLAILKNHHWIFKQAYKLSPVSGAKYYKEFQIRTPFNIERVRSAFANPETMSLWKLPDFIRHLKESGFSALKHEMYFYKMLAEPFLYFSMVLVSSAFSKKSLRQGTVAYTILGSILFGFITFFSNNIILAMVLSTGMPILVSSLAIPLITSLLCIGIIIQRED